MSDDLISKDHVKTMQSLSPWEDGDIYVLGAGRKAEYVHRKRAFIVTENGEFLGSVPKNVIIRRKK